MRQTPPPPSHAPPPQRARTHLTIPGVLSGTVESFILTVATSIDVERLVSRLGFVSEADIRKATTLDAKEADGNSEPTGIKLSEG